MVKHEEKKSVRMRTRINSSSMSVLTGLAIAAALGCSTAYYSTWEMFGKEKRDLLRSNVEDVRDDQQEAASIEADIETLIADMEASIAEADRFLRTLPE
jgi:uncharacterized protein HemX